MRALDVVRNARHDLIQPIKNAARQNMTTQANTHASTKSGPPGVSSSSDDSFGSSCESLRLRPQTASMGVIAQGV